LGVTLAHFKERGRIGAVFRGRLSVENKLSMPAIVVGAGFAGWLLF
jgi:hypothetical protein